MIDTRDIKTMVVNNRGIRYHALGSGWRYETLLDKEPETIEWISSFKEGETLWDIGANVGIYSVYAATRNVKVIAFEPHFANYFQLCLNIYLNKMQNLITPLCLALTQGKAVDHINLASLDFGTSMSSFGEALDFRGNPYQPVFQQGMVGYDIDHFVQDFKFPLPDHIKIDVDGIEEPIIKGGLHTLSQAKIKSISVELIDSDQQQVLNVTNMLKDAGFRFVHKKQNAKFATPETKDVMNFLFCR